VTTYTQGAGALVGKSAGSSILAPRAVLRAAPVAGQTPKGPAARVTRSSRGRGMVFVSTAAVPNITAASVISPTTRRARIARRAPPTRVPRWFRRLAVPPVPRRLAVPLDAACRLVARTRLLCARCLTV
jgi:hypothetical protein